MDPQEIQQIQQYMQAFGHAPPGITPQNLQLIQALQAAKAKAPAPATQPVTPVPVYNRATPGTNGAISDAVKAISSAVAPKSITQQAARQAAAEAANQ
jgi:hypothetical protein